MKSHHPRTKSYIQLENKIIQERIANANQIKGFNLNAAYLPLVCGFGINQCENGKETFGTRKDRVKALLQWIEEGDYDLITLQEMFDVKITNQLIKQLSEKGYEYIRGIPVPPEKTGHTAIPEIFKKYDYCCSTVTDKKEEVDLRCCFSTCSIISAIRGGLVIFSKFPILEIQGDVFPNPNPHTFDALVQKGFLAVKLKINDEEFITVYCSHLGAGGPRHWSEPTNSERRAEQLDFIKDHMIHTNKIINGKAIQQAQFQIEWEKMPPRKNSILIHKITLFAADTNINLAPESVTHDKNRRKSYVNNRRMLSISSGNSKNGKKTNEIKYENQHHFFRLFQPVVPGNFVNIKTRDEDGKPFILEEALIKVKNNEEFVSCTDNGAKNGNETRYGTHKLLDIVTIKNTDLGKLTNKILVKQCSNNKLISDHHAKIG